MHLLFRLLLTKEGVLFVAISFLRSHTLHLNSFLFEFNPLEWKQAYYRQYWDLHLTQHD